MQVAIATETLPVSSKIFPRNDMEHSEQEGDQRPSLPQQEQILQQQQQLNNRQGRAQQQQQQWTQQAGYYSASAVQRQYGQQQQQEMSSVGGTVVHPLPQQGQPDTEYHSQRHRGTSGYPPHMDYQSTAPQHHYGAYPQHYVPHHHPTQQQQMYHLNSQQQQMPVQGIQQPLHMQPQQQQTQPQMLTMMGMDAAAGPGVRHHPRTGMPPSHQHQPPYIQPTVGRLPSDRPLIKLSVSLIDTYKHINSVYYEERDARRAARAAQKAAAVAEAQRQAQQQAAAAAAAAAVAASSSSATGGGGGSTGQQQKVQGVNNNGWDDENYDYIITSGEIFYGRYMIKERIGKGSFGQVVRGLDMETNKDVAIKIIKSKKPFLMQAKTEIELLCQLCDKDQNDQNNIVRLVTHFIYRNHQCLVFEMLSLNLYELLKNTQFSGVSLNLIRKFAKQILIALAFLARPDVDIIHCDLKPENILLRHPKRSGVKVIDFGSSCRSNKRMYSYIQSRFYRSPEVMLGLPYSVAIDMWSLGCILAEMHTGEPLFSGSDQFDQMQKIVKLLGMVPSHMLDKSSDQHRLQFFERVRIASGGEVWEVKQSNKKASSSSKQQKQQDTSSEEPKPKVVPSSDPIASLSEVIGADSKTRKKNPHSEAGATARNYELFIDLIYRMLAYDPTERIKPEEALNHPFVAGELLQSSGSAAAGARRPSVDVPVQQQVATSSRTHASGSSRGQIRGAEESLVPSQVSGHHQSTGGSGRRRVGETSDKIQRRGSEQR